MKEIKDYSCPECNSIMKKGFVTTNHSIRWATDINQGNYSIINTEKLTKVGWLKNPKVSALRCKSCCLVLFKH